MMLNFIHCPFAALVSTNLFCEYLDGIKEYGILIH